MSRAWLIVALLLGCSASQTRDPPPPLAVARPIAPAARHVVGKLYPRFERQQVWPSRLCVDRDELVFEIDCCCNERVVCQLDRAENATLYLSLSVDTTTTACLSAVPMIPGRCPIPPAPADVVGHTWTIVINGQASLEMPVDMAGKVHDGDCWTGDR